MFQLTTDPARKLLALAYDTVFWDMEVALRFKAECAAAVASFNCAPGTHLVRVDLRNAVLQSQAVFDLMLGMVHASVAARMALVADSPIARMQTKRLQVRDNVRMFRTMEEADAWLFASKAAAAA